MDILVADDHAVVRRGLKQLLLEEYGAPNIGEAGHAAETLQLARTRDWDLIVLDISMPGMSGLEVLKELRQLRPQTPVLILSAHPEEQYALRVLKAGAAGYMNKESASEYLIEAVRKVSAGGRYISPAVAELLAAGIGTDTEKLPHEILSDREFLVLCLIASGKTVGQIGAELSLSVKTISTYRARTLTKMGMKTNADLTRYAIRHGLV